MASKRIIRKAFVAALLGLLSALVFTGSANAVTGSAPRAAVYPVPGHTYSPGDRCEGWATFNGNYVTQLDGRSTGTDCSFDFTRYHNGVRDLDYRRYVDGTGEFWTSTVFGDDTTMGYHLDIVVCDLGTGACGQTDNE